MSDLFSNLGIEWKVLIAQAINFAILFFVLSKFVWKPIKTVLDKRASEIVEAKENSEKINRALSAIEETRKQSLSETRVESQKLIDEALKRAVEATEKIMTETKLAAGKVTEEERKKMALEKDKVIQEIKRDIGSVVAGAIEKVAGDSIDEKSKQKMLEKAVGSINK